MRVFKVGEGLNIGLIGPGVGSVEPQLCPPQQDR